jgi:hypothetical protein
MSANNPVHKGRSRHISIRYHLIREIISYGVVEIIWITTEDNIADIGTKALNVNTFEIHNGRIYAFRIYKMRLPFGKPVETKPNTEYV